MAILNNKKGQINDLVFLLKKTSMTIIDLICLSEKEINIRADINKIKSKKKRKINENTSLFFDQNQQICKHLDRFRGKKRKDTYYQHQERKQ